MSRPTSPFRIADYRRFWITRFFSVLATNGMVVIMGYQLYDIARKIDGLSMAEASFRLGMLGLAQFLPMFLLTPISGMVADRFDRRFVGAIAVAGDVGVAMTLAITTSLHALTLPLLYVLGFAHGLARVFLWPAVGSIAPRIVPPEMLPRAIALNSMAMQIGIIFGPALAGLMFAQAAALPYWVSSALLALSAMAVLTIAPMPPVEANRNAHPLHQIAEGFHFVRHSPFLLGCMTLDLFAVLLGGATALLPVYARDILHVGSAGLGQMRSAPALGAALVGIAMSIRPLSHNVGVKMLLAVAAYGAATVVFGVSRNYPLSLAMLAVLGAADMISVFIRNSLVQLYTPDDKRGRVSAISGLAISASNELGEMESGVAASLLGATGAVVLGGVAAIVITVVWAWLFPQIRRARTFSAPETFRESTV